VEPTFKERGAFLPPQLPEAEANRFIEGLFEGLRRQESIVPPLNVVGVGTTEDRRRNILYSIGQTKKRLSISPENDGWFSIAGYGPSLVDSLPFLVEEVTQGFTVCTTSGAHDYLLTKGIRPDYHAEMDPRARKAEFVRSPHKDIEYLIASVCHLDMWRNLEGFNTRLWHLADLPEIEGFVAQLEPDAMVFPSAQCIGLTAIAVGHAMGFRKFSLHGMDCSYKDGEPHAGEHNGSNSDDRRFKVRCGETYYQTRIEWIQYARNFVEIILQRMPGCEFRIHGDGLLQRMVKEAMNGSERN
jgi:hypothetical protein